VTARYLDHLTNGAAFEALERADLPELDGWRHDQEPGVGDGRVLS
jgi:hypothetical protein